MIYLENLSDALVECACSSAAAGQTYLVSDGDDVSSPELIRRIATALNCTVNLIPFPPALLRLCGRIAGKTGAVERLLGSLTVDSSKIQAELNWTPPFTMQEGLATTAEWFLRDN